MKLVPYPPGFKPARTWWCTQCDRFQVAVPGVVPVCPVHKTPMVDDPADPRRIESAAPVDNPARRRKRSLVFDQGEVLAQTRSLEGIVTDRPIPIISNAEDDDLRHLAANGLLFRGKRPSLSDPTPRHRWSGRLDPAWVAKFQPVLEGCDVAVYARRPGTLPNPATQLELDLLRQFSKRVIVFEPEDM